MATRPNQTSPVVRAGIYTRISWDPAGQRAGVERQRVDCEALCADRGWEIAHYFEDNDRSAYGRNRPAYEGLLAAVEERRLGAVVTWHNDRLHRSPRELEAFIDLVERRGVRMAVVSGGDYDLTTPEGRFTARIVGAVARKESEVAAAGSGASTSSWPNRAGRRATSGGACATTLSVSWCGRRLAGSSPDRASSPSLGTGTVASLRDDGVPVDGANLAEDSPLGAHRRPAGARRRPTREGPGRVDARCLGRGDRPPNVGTRPGRAPEPRAAHPREHPDEVPPRGRHLLRHVRRENVLPPSGRPHEALRVRRPSPRPPADDRGPARRRSGRPARPGAPHDAGLS